MSLCFYSIAFWKPKTGGKQDGRNDNDKSKSKSDSNEEIMISITKEDSGFKDGE